MCIFAQPVVSVSDTSLFARLLPDGWQYLVYQMRFVTKQDNAMVLPLPVQLPAMEKGTLEFISLKEYERFFRDLEKGFPISIPDQPRSRSFSLPSGPTDSKLAVEDVGDFIASFVPSPGEFGRLDEQFRLPKESLEQIPQYANYGFAVFQLKSRTGKPHPMAFKFRSRLNVPGKSSIYFPTVHIHDGQVHDREEFDHTLYLQATEFDKVCGAYDDGTVLWEDPATGYVRSKWKAKEFCNLEACRGIVAGDALVHRLKMSGLLKNADVRVNLDLSRGRNAAGMNPIEGWRTAACAAGVSGFMWLIDRRDHLARERASTENHQV